LFIYQVFFSLSFSFSVIVILFVTLLEIVVFLGVWRRKAYNGGMTV